VSTYSIGEVAARSGFSASALRYYEGIGLVQPSARTAAGYRMYDEHTLARLSFITRAKQLGCSLDEIADLVSVWDGERCGAVQRRFHALVTEKIGTVRHQLRELTAFAAQLEHAAEQLSAEPVDGPCDDGCACLATTPLAGPPTEVPIACTLDPAAMPERLDDWRDVLAMATTRRSTADGGLRIELDDRVDVADLARLVAAEQRCCAFFSFALTVDQRGTALEVRAPDGAAAAVAELFGQPT
jgi:DNA-binding transcriptional MerR regulator